MSDPAAPFGQAQGTPPGDSEVIHRLKNHLAIIVGFADLVVADSAAGDPRLADLLEIQKAARDALAMMPDLDKRMKR
jgi:hypothetical protein